MQNESIWEYFVRFDAAIKGMVYAIEADETRCAQLADMFGMKQLHALKVDIETTPVPLTLGEPRLRLMLKLEADVSQECGVSLEIFRHTIHTDLVVECVAAALDHNIDVVEAELSLSDLDEPDRIENNQLDLGLYIIEALGDAYDPFARAPGAVFIEPDTKPEPSPFAILSKLTPKQS